MPVYAILCPDCGHASKTLVLEGCKMPSEWPCSRCGGRGARAALQQERHPWESSQGSACLCCGVAHDGPAAFACDAADPNRTEPSDTP